MIQVRVKIKQKLLYLSSWKIREAIKEPGLLRSSVPESFTYGQIHAPPPVLPCRIAETCWAKYASLLSSNVPPLRNKVHTNDVHVPAEPFATT